MAQKKKSAEDLNFYENIGDKIQEIRKAKELTQEDLARKLGISRAVIAGYETGRAKIPLITLFNLAELFGVSIDYLITKRGSLREYNIDHNLDYLSLFSAAKNMYFFKGKVELEEILSFIFDFIATEENRLLDKFIVGKIKGIIEKNLKEEIPLEAELNMENMHGFILSKLSDIYKLNNDILEEFQWIVNFTYIICEYIIACRSREKIARDEEKKIKRASGTSKRRP